jgi:hypothetical protein
VQQVAEVSRRLVGRRDREQHRVYRLQANARSCTTAKTGAVEIRPAQAVPTAMSAPGVAHAVRHALVISPSVAREAPHKDARRAPCSGAHYRRPVGTDALSWNSRQGIELNWVCDDPHACRRDQGLGPRVRAPAEPVTQRHRLASWKLAIRVAPRQHGPTSGSAEATLSSGRFSPTVSPTEPSGDRFPPVFPQVHRPIATHPDTTKGGRVTAKPQVEALFGAK